MLAGSIICLTELKNWQVIPDRALQALAVIVASEQRLPLFGSSQWRTVPVPLSNWRSRRSAMR